jgi:hypothetical protein
VDPDPVPWLKLMDPDPDSNGDADPDSSVFITDLQHPNPKICPVYYIGLFLLYFREQFHRNMLLCPRYFVVFL